MSTNSSLARKYFLRPTLEENGIGLGHTSLGAVWWVIFENILHCVTKQDHSGQERGMIKDTKI